MTDDANFATCQSDLRGFGGTDNDIAAMTVFYGATFRLIF